MRQRALSKGYTLNEHGMSYMTKGLKGDKVETIFPDEKSIFDFYPLSIHKIIFLNQNNLKIKINFILPEIFIYI